MAGIGWRLERLIARGTLPGAFAAYATGAAVMALPWALTTLVLAVLPFLVGSDAAGFAAAETVVTIAYSAALLVDGPFQVVIARHTADRLYERRLGAVAGPLCLGIGCVSLASAGVTAAILGLAGHTPAGVLTGAALAATAGAQWTALSVGNGLGSPELVLGSVGAGAAIGAILAPVSVVLFGHGVTGYLAPLIAGQGVTLACLLTGALRALPEGAGEGGTLLPAFREYAFLAVAGLSFNASLFVDKVIVWWLADDAGREFHAAASTLAWVSTIPCLAWIFVEVETRFQRRFRAFYARLEGGAPLAELRAGVQGLGCEIRRLLRGAVEVQAGMTLLLEAASATLVDRLHLPSGALLPLRLLLLAAGLQAVALLGLILLYYFDLRRDACLAAAGLLGAIGAGTAGAALAGQPPGAGTVLGCLAGTSLAWWRLVHGVRGILGRTLLGQPFGNERLDRPFLDRSRLVP